MFWVDCRQLGQANWRLSHWGTSRAASESARTMEYVCFKWMQVFWPELKAMSFTVIFFPKFKHSQYVSITPCIQHFLNVSYCESRFSCVNSLRPHNNTPGHSTSHYHHYVIQRPRKWRYREEKCNSDSNVPSSSCMWLHVYRRQRGKGFQMPTFPILLFCLSHHQKLMHTCSPTFASVPFLHPFFVCLVLDQNSRPHTCTCRAGAYDAVELNPLPRLHHSCNPWQWNILLKCKSDPEGETWNRYFPFKFFLWLCLPIGFWLIDTAQPPPRTGGSDAVTLGEIVRPRLRACLRKHSSNTADLWVPHIAKGHSL